VVALCPDDKPDLERKSSLITLTLASIGPLTALPPVREQQQQQQQQPVINLTPITRSTSDRHRASVESSTLDLILLLRCQQESTSLTITRWARDKPITTLPSPEHGGQIHPIGRSTSTLPIDTRCQRTHHPHGLGFSRAASLSFLSPLLPESQPFHHSLRAPSPPLVGH
jgi:hypothetical protein